MKSALLALMLASFAAGPASASQLVDCNCVASLPALQTNGCQGIVPNLCLLATNCFSTSVVIGAPGYCSQSPAPGTVVGPGTTAILFTVMDTQSNSAQCVLSFTVNPPTSTLSLTCASNKTVQCGTSWNFDPPTAVSTCCNPAVNLTLQGTVTNGTCPQAITQNWKATDACGNNATCSQTVTLVDTDPPVAICSTFNLVINGDFELYTNCPSSGGQFSFTVPWFNPTAGTPDYYNSCSPVGTGFSTPTNILGNQIPFSGQAYAGAFVYTTSGTSATNSYREYLEVPLLTPLIAGKSYRVSFYVSLAEQCSHAIAEIGAHLSVNPVISNGISTVLSVVPQVVNPSTNLLTSTNSWMLVQGTFTAAGGEKYLTLGNFRSDPATTAAPAAGTLFTGYSYYYYDVVSVIELCGPEATNKTVLCGSYWTFDQPIGYDDCSGYNVTVSVIGTVTNSICPLNATRTWLLADLCGNTNLWSQTVHILDTNPPVALCAAGANLVPNPSFENYAYCPYFFSQVSDAVPWFNPTIATPDYLNTCSGFGQVSVPTNYFGSQTPLTGQGYCGAFVYSQFGNNPPPGYREYLQAPLLAPLNPGQTYLVSFHVSLSDFSAFAIAEIGAHFSVGPVFQNDQAVMALTPQVVNPSTNLLTSTNGWMLVQGTFTAIGGEDHLTLGNFLNDALTTAVPAATGVPDYMTNFSYYYYDDVSVVALCSSQATNKTVVCGTTWTFDPPIGFDNCSGTNVSVTVASTVTNGNCPILITRTWILADMCGNTNTWSQTVTLLDNTPPFVDCVCASNAVAPLLTTNACYAFVPDLSSLTNFGCFAGNCGPVQFSQSPPPGTPAGLGVHPITVSAFSCGGASNGCVLPFTVSQPPSSLSLVCPTNKTVQCGSLWIFDPPVPITSCCNPACTFTPLSTTSNGSCAQVLTRVWLVTDACNNTATCTQTVTVVDTTPPATMCSGINLVPNGDFEFFTNCPFADSQFNFAWPWFMPTAGSSDYFNSCGGPGSPVSTPINVVGNRTPLSGQAYAGAFVYGPLGLNPTNYYREYLEVPLSSPLIAGQQYRVSFNVSRSPFYGYAAAEIGARLSVGPIISNNFSGVLNVVPQVVNPSTNVITSTTNWTLIQGVFTAVGGEDYLTLGNFRTDPATTTVLIGGFDNSVSYYYFDDAAVIPVCPSSVTNKIVSCGAPIIFNPPTGFDNCSGTNVAVSIASTIFSNLCPATVTRTWTLTDLCGNTNSWSQTITTVNTNSPYALCSNTNLVPNSQFENYSPCPNAPAEFNCAAPWFTPTGSSPDYLNTCAAPASLVSVPANLAGSQPALSGNGYAGAVVYTSDNNDLSNSYREYIEVPLIAPLAAGQSYLVSYYVSLADDSSFAIAEIGARLSVGPLTNFAIQTCLPVVPQVMNPAYNLLTSTSSWMHVQGIYTAGGGENHLTLGNFFGDNTTTAVPRAGTIPYAYYYFEDVSIAPLCPLVTNKFVPCGMPITFDQPLAFDPCSATNVNLSVVTVTNNNCPLGVTRTWTYTNLFGCAKSWSQTVSFTNNSSITINCACLQDSILSLLTTNGCSGKIPNLSLLTNSPCISGGNTNCGPLQFSQSPPAGTVVGPGITPVTVSFSRCSGASNGCVLPFFVYSQPPVVICPPNLHLLTCFSGTVAYFTPIAFGNVGPVVCSPPSGSVFPIGNTTVTCTATNACGLAASCTFTVSVRQIFTRWGCVIIAIGIPTDPIGGSTVAYRPALPGGGNGVDLGNFGSSGQDGMRFQFGPAQKFTFSTVLDFNAPDGARINLSLPDANGGPSTRLLSFVRSCQPHCGWNLDLSPQIVDGTTATLRSIAIGTNGELFSSFTQPLSSLGTNVPLSLTAMNGATGAVMTVSLDCRSREVTLDFPLCAWTPDPARKGWDGCIYGNALRGGALPSPGGEGQGEGEPSTHARLILTPLTSTPPAPITNLDLTASNLTQVAFDNPSITAVGRKWGDGHVTLMKAYDDGEQGVEFVAAAAGGGPIVDLGHASAFQFRVRHFEDGDIPTEEQLYSIRGWPPGPLTNRPPPPPIMLRLVRGSNSVDCSADFATLGVSNVTLQLWNGPSLVSQEDHVTASISNSIATLSAAPVILGSPGLGVLSLAHTNPFTVLSGLDCTVCEGTELRILPELPPTQAAPVVYTELQSQVSEGVDLLFYRFQRTLACVPGPLTVTRTTDGIALEWTDDKFRLEGAETLSGPWYDLGVQSPVNLPANSRLRLFRLSCD